MHNEFCFLSSAQRHQADRSRCHLLIVAEFFLHLPGWETTQPANAPGPSPFGRTPASSLVVRHSLTILAALPLSTRDYVMGLTFFRNDCRHQSSQAATPHQ